MPAEALIFVRWIHLVAGITWIGLLYFFNFVNVRSMATIDATARPHVVTTLLPRALAWFRHSAWVTVLVGLVLIYYLYWQDGFSTDGDKTITTGGIVGIVMAVNVWMFIWPNQRRIIEATRAAAKPDPSWGRTALYASRTNFALSFPMLFFMGAASHYPMDWPGIAVVGVALGALGLGVVLTVQKWWAPRF